MLLSSLDLPSSAGILLAVALICLAILFFLFRSMGRLFGVGSSSARTPGTEGDSSASAAGHEQRVKEELQHLLPDYIANYAWRRSDASTTDAIRIAREVKPEDSTGYTELALSLAELQVQVQNSQDAIAKLEAEHAQKIETLTTRALTPERVTVIASGMAVGLVLLLCTFGALLLGALDAASDEDQAPAAPYGIRQATAPEGQHYCVVETPNGAMAIRSLSDDQGCPIVR